MTLNIIPIPAFNDNYIWMIHDNNHAIVVDPGTAEPVEAYLMQHQLTLVNILITHHHWDHVNGVSELQDKWNCVTYAPKDERIPGKLTYLQELDEIHIPSLNIRFNVFETPGHTLSHICYFNHHWLFCGDTLFSIGCGRMFEGTPQQYVQSLSKIKQLDPETLVYCTHEYTLNNIDFALSIEPRSQVLQQLKKDVHAKLAEGHASLPVPLKQELQLNPFLKTDDLTINNAVSSITKDHIDSEVTCFATLRKLKDQF